MAATDHMTHITDGRLERSLTPNTDAVEIAIADMRAKLGPKLLLPGPAGARARVGAACQEAIHRAVAAELDAGAPEAGVTSILLLCLGDAIAAHALKFTHDKPAPERVKLLEMFFSRLWEQSKALVEQVNDMAPHEISGVVAPRSKPTGSC